MESNGLPISILQSFQSLSVSSTSIDFGPEFASNKTPEEFVVTVNQYLQLHNSNKVKKFSLFFCPLDQFLADIENWVAFAVAKEVEELNLDLSMGFDPWKNEFPNGEKSFKLPTSLFECKTLTHLSLSHCDFYPFPDFSGFDHLYSLSLTYVNITDDKLQQLIANCPFLESLSLKTCPSLQSIIISSQRLRRLTIVNPWEAYHMEISAPKLESFIYYGMYIFGFSWDMTLETSDSFTDISLLSDAFISSIDLENSEPEDDYIQLLYDLKHVKVLTVCTATLWRVTLYEDVKLPILLQNLKELQLLMDSMSSQDLACIYGFFRLCPTPFLEKLFIQLPTRPEDPNKVCCVIKVVEEPSEVVFNYLKVIKLSKFKGCKSEMRLVKFLLEKAIVLESLVLVAPPNSDLKEHMDIEQDDSVQEAAYNEMKEDLMNQRSKLASLPKASPVANIVLCECLEDDNKLTPTHTEYFCEF